MYTLPFDATFGENELWLINLHLAKWSTKQYFGYHTAFLQLFKCIFEPELIRFSALSYKVQSENHHI